MENLIIIAIVVIAAGVGLSSTLKHFKGQGGCCGGGSYKPKKKRLSRILYKKSFFVSGMSCEHCKNRVEEIVNDIAGVSGSVHLKKGKLTVSYAEIVDDELIRASIERAGYTVTRIENEEK